MITRLPAPASRVASVTPAWPVPMMMTSTFMTAFVTRSAGMFWARSVFAGGLAVQRVTLSVHTSKEEHVDQTDRGCVGTARRRSQRRSGRNKKAGEAGEEGRARRY